MMVPDVLIDVFNFYPQYLKGRITDAWLVMIKAGFSYGQASAKIWDVMDFANRNHIPPSESAELQIQIDSL